MADVNCSKVSGTASKIATVLCGSDKPSLMYNSTNTRSPHKLANSYFLCHVSGNVFVGNVFPGNRFAGKVTLREATVN